MAQAQQSTTVADMLRARDLIDDQQHAAAERFRAARAQALAQSTARLREEGPVARYNELCGRLTEEQHIEVAAVVLEQRPSWLRRKLLGLPLTRDDLAERRHLLDGLDALAG